MKKKIAVLGSTGSIGSTTLSVISKNKKNLNLILLSTNKNIKKIYKQALFFKTKNVIIHNFEQFNKYSYIFKRAGINVFNNTKEFSKKNKKKIDYTMSSITGLDGLGPTLDIIPSTKNIAIANKESIICAWNLIENKLKKYKTKFIPVDSEHYSILELIKTENKNTIKKIYITASGGPFLNLKKKNIINKNSNFASKHPTWKMGKKISIDSSTLMNKIFELIEAKKIFNIKKSILDIIIEPSSYVHAIVDFKYGVSKILTHPTSMEIPIFNSLFDHRVRYEKFNNIDFTKLNNLKFQKIDNNKFPINKILKKIPDNNSLFETILVTANDTLVNLFLKKKIKFYDIYKILDKVLRLKEFKKYFKIKPKNIKQIQVLSNKVRLKTQSLSVISRN